MHKTVPGERCACRVTILLKRSDSHVTYLHVLVCRHQLEREAPCENQFTKRSEMFPHLKKVLSLKTSFRLRTAVMHCVLFRVFFGKSFSSNRYFCDGYLLEECLSVPCKGLHLWLLQHMYDGARCCSKIRIA